jgi:hypothetical protein
MKGSISLVDVVLDPVEKIFTRSLPNCAAGSALFCQVWRSISIPMAVSLSPETMTSTNALKGSA